MKCALADVKNGVPIGPQVSSQMISCEAYVFCVHEA